jgi:hypothetical protein
MIDLSRRGWMFVIAAAVLAGLSAVLAKQWLPGAVASGVAAAAAVVGGVWVARGSSILQTRDARRGALGGEVWTSGSRQLPRVRELDDALALGVHPAAGSRKSQFDRVPPFIRREVEGELLRALRQARFVLLVGESTAGKSRMAYELVRNEFPEYHVVIPARRESALAAAELAADTPRSVLWLDDLERFLGSGGLTGAAVRQILSARGTERFIVATMRSEEYAGFSGRASTGLAAAGRDVMRQGRDVLRLAACVQVPRRWSPADVARARQRSDDPRLAEAVIHAAEYGVAEYLAAGPQLLAELRDAWAPAAHPRAAAMVLAAVDARRAGVHRPLPQRVLLEMHEPYLQERGGHRLRPETPDSALAWATDPLFATSSLLMPVDGGYLAFDYLIDAVSQERMPEKALEPLIAFATANEAMDVGRLARGWSWIKQADLAFQRAEAGGLFEGTSHRCWLLRQEQGLPAALQFAQDAVTWTTAAYGPENLQTLKARFLAGCETGNSGDSLAAQRLLEDLADHAVRALGTEHPFTLDVRDGAAQFTRDNDAYAGLGLTDELVQDCARILGEDDDLTISCRERAAYWRHKTGDHARAVQIFQALLTDMTERFHSPDSDTIWIRAEMAECLAEIKDLPAAAIEWQRIIDEASNSFGRLEATSLELRRRHAWCVGETGDAPGAVALLTTLLAEAAVLESADLFLLLEIRQALAWWTGVAGDPAAAVRELSALLPEAAGRGSEDLHLKRMQHMLEYWRAISGTADGMQGRLQPIIDQMRHDFGPDHGVTRLAQNTLAEIRAMAPDKLA